MYGNGNPVNNIDPTGLDDIGILEGWLESWAGIGNAIIGLGKGVINAVKNPEEAWGGLKAAGQALTSAEGWAAGGERVKAVAKGVADTAVGAYEEIKAGNPDVNVGRLLGVAHQMAILSGAKVKTTTSEVANPVPKRMARVVPAEYVNGSKLASPSASEAWVTAASDLKGIKTSAGLAKRLTLVDDTGKLISGPRAVIEFDAVTEGLASPVFRLDSGFVGGGKTLGGAREFVVPNFRLDQLNNVTTRIVP